MQPTCDPIRVLHVDDEADFADLVAKFLQQEDERFDVETSTSTSEALEHLASEDVDCVVSDYDMPEQNGIEFLRDVRSECPGIPFILYTGKGSEEVASDAISAGVTDYLQKQSGTGQYAVLANRIRNAVDKYYARSELADREKRLNLFFEQTPLGVVEWDEEFRFVRLNDAAEDILGYDQAELAGQSWEAIVPESDRDDVGSVVSDLLENAGGHRSVNENVRKDGEVIVCEWHNRVVTDEDGAVTAIFSHFQDITDRRREEGRREQIVNRVTDAIVEVDSDWTFTLVNDQAEELYGMDEEQLLGRGFWDVFAEARDTRFEEEYREVMETREPASFTEYYSGLDGWFDIEVYPKADGGIAFYFREVTDRVERSRELERQNERFQYVEDVADIGYWEIDAQSPEPHDVTLSDGVYHVHDLSPDEPFDVERGIQFYHPADRPAVRNAVERAISDAEPYDHEVRLITAAGRERWVHSVGEPVERDGEVTKVRGVFQDVTERKRKEQELARQNERLEEFASIVAHDLRNPLHVAEGNLELASEECDSERIADASNAVDRSLALIEDLLTLAREGERVSDVEPVELADVVERCWRTVATAEAGLVAETGLTVLADRSRLRQLLENLMRNAVEHGGADVTVRVGDIEGNRGFFVEDDGGGIPEDERDDVFDAGYSTREDGTGFGLNIVREIAAAHGWEVGVAESEAGGARFEITDIAVA